MDPVALSSDVGTWAATLIAIIALIGVIGPYLALYASLSEENRAMNAVRDVKGKYVSRGFPMINGLRIWRKVRVPDLAPGYASNDGEGVLISGAASRDFWTLQAREFLPWNTGWAKFIEMLDGYSVIHITKDSKLTVSTTNLVNDLTKRAGTLEVVNGKTALVVSKHWILLVGLLGRYGLRLDKGILWRAGIRDDLDGERGSLSYLMKPYLSEGMPGMGMFHPPRRKSRPRVEHAYDSFMARRPPTRPATSASESSDDCSDDFSDDSDNDKISSGSWPPPPWGRPLLPSHLRRASSVFPRLSRPQNSTVQDTLIHGITGTMIDSGKQRGSHNTLTTLTFIPHAAQQIFGSTLQRQMSDHTSVATHFWLAHGFLPDLRSTEQFPISMDLPQLQDSSRLRDFNLNTDWLSKDPNLICAVKLSLQDIDDIPIVIGNAMRCLGIQESKVFRFLPVHPEKEPDTWTLPVCDELENGRKTQQNQQHHGHSPPTRGHEEYQSGPYHFIVSMDHGITLVFLETDLERVISSFLNLDWGDIGYLVGASELLQVILTHSTEILKIPDRSARGISSFFGSEEPLHAMRLPPTAGFDQVEVRDRVKFDRFLDECFDGRGVKPLRSVLGVLFITQHEFRTRVMTCCTARWTRLVTRDRDSEGIARANRDLDVAEKVVKEMLPGREKPDVGLGTGSSTEKSSTQHEMRRKYLDDESLRSCGIEYTLDEDNPRKVRVVFSRDVPQWEQTILLEHSRKVRSLRHRRKFLKKRETELATIRQAPDDFLRFNFQSRILTWYAATTPTGRANNLDDSVTMKPVASWHLNSELRNAPGRPDEIEISEKDIIFVGYWAANRAALWLGAQDSRPLLEFVDKLDPYVYVL